MKKPLLTAAFATVLLAGCNSESRAAEEKRERDAQQAAAIAGAEAVALGLTEAQLLDADLIGPDGAEIGEVEEVVRGPSGKVERLLVEVEDTTPDRYVHVPIESLTPVKRGDDTDLSTTMTKQQLQALPEVKRQPR
ncbi:PRC-barrel domain-containing protein [Sphingomonas sp. 179-I 2A4 NHS]|uniref:PRC-barrel domain-containing protein n=1 Tax=unclassified Sphingomonas TaxID=196159 RepID=UPI00387A4B15